MNRIKHIMKQVRNPNSNLDVHRPKVQQILKRNKQPRQNEMSTTIKYCKVVEVRVTSGSDMEPPQIPAKESNRKCKDGKTFT